MTESYPGFKFGPFMVEDRQLKHIDRLFQLWQKQAQPIIRGLIISEIEPNGGNENPLTTEIVNLPSLIGRTICVTLITQDPFRVQIDDDHYGQIKNTDSSPTSPTPELTLFNAVIYDFVHSYYQG